MLQMVRNIPNQNEALLYLYILILQNIFLLATIGDNSCKGDSIKAYDGTYGPYYGYSCAYFQGVFLSYRAFMNIR